MCVATLYCASRPLNFQVAFVTFLPVPEPQRPLSPLPPRDDQPLAEDLTRLIAAATFDVHAWFAAYLAEPRDDDAVELAGVPFH